MDYELKESMDDLRTSLESLERKLTVLIKLQALAVGQAADLYVSQTIGVNKSHNEKIGQKVVDIIKDEI